MTRFLRLFASHQGVRLRLTLLFPGLLLLALALTPGINEAVIMQADTALEAQAGADDCSEIRFLMAQDRMPYDFAIGGGELTFNTPLNGQLGVEDWANYHIFRLGDDVTSAQAAQLTLTFPADDTTLTLEAGVVYSTSLLPEERSTTTPGYTTIMPDTPDDERTLRYTLTQAGVYTVVVRRPYISDPENVGVYSLNASLDTEAAPLGSLRIAASSDSDSAVVEQVGGRQLVRFNTGAEAYVNAESINLLQDRLEQRVISFQGKGTINLAASTRAHYTGGGIGVRWTGSEGPLMLYLERFDFASESNSTLDTSLPLVGNFFRTDWRNIQSFWMLDGCFGFKLRETGDEGIRFIARLDPSAERDMRVLTRPGSIDDLTCPEFYVALKAPAADQPAADYNFCMDWTGIQPGSEIRLADGVLHLELVGERSLELQTTRIVSFRRSTVELGTAQPVYGANYVLTDGEEVSGPYQPQNQVDVSENTPLTIEFIGPDDQDIELITDWINLKGLKYRAPASETQPDAASSDDTEDVGESDEADPCAGQTRCLTFEFSDDDPVRTVAYRGADGLQTVEALDDVIWIQYRGQRQEPGEQRLLLPASETYIELVTPAGAVPTFGGEPFNGRALPGTPGYAPRALNNLGGECYPLNTLLPEVNCAANGYPNPANGNLWYSVTDHNAAGALLDLTLTRSYNSADAALDGPFGKGWSTQYRLDYQLEYDELTGARTVTAANVNDYRVGLDLIYAPRKMIIYNAPSGSRHVFVNPHQNVDFFRSLTMPGWVLFRSNIRRSWTMVQDNGLEINFDRAGRLTGYGYPDQARYVSIGYTARLENRLDGPGGYGDSNFVRITDQSQLRQIELYFDQQAHIYRSVLRDFTTTPDYSLACSLVDNCYETLYKYDSGGHLIQVVYPNRLVATYSYDEQGHLISHADPRAPLAASMGYTYTEDGLVESVRIGDDVGSEESRDFLRLDYQETGTTERQTTVTDEYGSDTTYSYTLDGGVWESPGTTFRLRRVVQPGKQVTNYTWSDQVVTRTETQINGQPYRTVEYAFSRNRGGVIGTPKTLVQILENNSLIRYKIDDSTAFESSDSVYFGEPTSITFEDASSVKLWYKTDKTRAHAFQFQDRDGTIYVINRYTSQDKANWIHEVDRYVPTAAGYIQDLMRLYDYSPVGLVSVYLQQRLQDTSADRYTVVYQYDGLGQPIRITDSELGTYNLNYEVFPCGNSTPAASEQLVCREVTITDPQNAVMVYRYDDRDQLVEVRLQEGESDPAGFLRKTTYAYDERGRLTAETQYADDVSCDQKPEDCLKTTYRYEASPASDAASTDPSGSGYRIIRTDPGGLIRLYAYDALNRLIRVEDQTGQEQSIHTTEYGYETRSGETLVTQVDQYASGSINTIYRQDLSQRLTGVTYAPKTSFELDWKLGNHSSYQRLQQIDFGSGAGQLNLKWNDNGFPASLTSSDVALNLEGRGAYSQPALDFDLTYDSGQLAYMQNAGNNTGVQVTTCTELKGARRVIYYRRSGENSAPVDCDLVNSGVDAIYEYDVHQRLTRVSTDLGTRTFTYAPSTLESNRWQVTMTATTAADSTGASDEYTWVLVYNFAGDLTAWTDENGVTRRYSYDRVGRLIRVSTEDETDEATRDFSYNPLNQVTEVKDGLGRGSRYIYNAQFQLRYVVTLPTGDTTCYAYNADRQVSLVLRYRADRGAEPDPEGESCPDAGTLANPIDRYEFRYDAANPTLLTDVIDPAGKEHRYTWNFTGDFRSNRLTYTDPGGHPTDYTFNYLGQLQVARDAAGNIFQWTYNSLGYPATYVPPEATGSLRLDYLPTYDAGNRLLIGAVQTTQQLSGQREQYIWRETLKRSLPGQLTGRDSLGQLAISYDPFGRLSGINAVQTSGSIPFDWQFNREDGQSRMEFQPGTQPAFTFDFDALFRMRAITDGSSTTAYRYITPLEGDTRLEALNGEGDGWSQRYLDGALEYREAGMTRLYRYDLRGNLTDLFTITCTPQSSPGCEGAPAAVERHVTYTINASGQVEQIIYSDDTTETFAYDPAGSLIAYTLDSETFTAAYTYEYNDAGYLTAVNVPGDVRLLYRYEGVLPVEVCQTSTTLNQDYDACVNSGGMVERASYDILGRLTGRLYPGYKWSRASGDPQGSGRTRSLDTSPAPDVPGISLSYTPFGLPLTDTSGAQITYTADGLNLPWKLDTGQSDRDGQLYEFTYRLNPAPDPGQPLLLAGIQTADPFASVQYEYDGDGRISTLRTGGRTYQYNYTFEGLTIIDQDQPELEVMIPHREPPTPPDPVATILPNAGYDAEAERYVKTEAYQGGMMTSRYDLNLHPLDTEVIDADGVGYTVTAVYNDAGVRTGETRTYADGTIIQIEYTYAKGSGRDIRVIPALPLTGATITVNPDRPLPEPEQDTQNNAIPFSHELRFNYDDVGNLTEIIYYGPLSFLRESGIQAGKDKRLVEFVCYRYRYDRASRLTQVERGLEVIRSGEGNALQFITDMETVATYRYDAAGRVIRIGEYTFVYVADQTVPAFVYDADGNGRLITDVNQRPVYADFAGFDVIGHPLPLSNGEITPYAPDALVSAADFTNPCGVGLPVGDGKPEAGMLYNALLVDPATGLMFGSGRVYSPLVGRYLQRDPQGTDLAGRVYDYPSRVSTPPLSFQSRSIATGLQVMAQADALKPASIILTADDVLKSTLPSGDPGGSDLSSRLTRYTDSVDAMIRQQLNFPVWLTRQYNQSGPVYDRTSGSVTWQQESGQVTTNNLPVLDFNAAFWDNRLALNSPLLTPDLVMDSLFRYHRNNALPPGTYLPYGWHSPERWTNYTEHPVLPTNEDTLPGSVFEILKQPWWHLSQNVEVVMLIDESSHRYQLSGIDVVSHLLEDALPQLDLGATR